jgi:hypothetical protein
MFINTAFASWTMLTGNVPFESWSVLAGALDVLDVLTVFVRDAANLNPLPGRLLHPHLGLAHLQHDVA